MIKSLKNNIENGLDMIKQSLLSCPKTPGVYIFSNKNEVLYIGKAKNLFKRVKSYLGFTSQTRRIKKMISYATNLKFINTHTESDALLLEDNLIKKHKPIFNIRLIDDKSFPYILISKSNSWSRLQVIRGQKKNKGFYFGPFSSPSAVRNVVSTIEKGFLIRNCNDNFFKNRKRPCMQYQIKRCSAPCVNLIDNRDYEKQTEQAISFLKGDDKKVRETLISRMFNYSKNQNFEEAAKIRDRIKSLSKINLKNFSVINQKSSFDIMCFGESNNSIFVQVFFFRNGKNLGNKEYRFLNSKEKEIDDSIRDFIATFYFRHESPSEIIINKNISKLAVIEEAIKKLKQKKITIQFAKKGQKKDLLMVAEKNLENSIKRYLQSNLQNEKILKDLKLTFDLKKIPKRIEVFDNSHLNGQNPIGAMIVFENGKFDKSSYRKFNIKDVEKTNDDYLMMKQVLQRRFNLQKNKNTWKNVLPDLVLIDGGKGHLNIAEDVLKNFKSIELVAIAKGKNRNKGNESFFMKNKYFKLKENSHSLFFLQNLRDEAHRFAITTQRTKRIKNIYNSAFDDLNGIGGKLKKLLLSHFGSLEGVKTAGLKDLKKVPGIGNILAQKVYDEFN